MKCITREWVTFAQISRYIMKNIIQYVTIAVIELSVNFGFDRGITDGSKP